MTLPQKFKCFSFSEIVGLKSGKIAKCKDGKCYQSYGWVKAIMHIYYALVPFFFFFLLLTSIGFFKNIFGALLVAILLTGIILYILEYLLFLITPLKEVKCYLIDVYKLKNW